MKNYRNSSFRIALAAIAAAFSVQASVAQSYLNFFQGLPPGTVLDTVQMVFTVRTPQIKALDSYPQRIDRISKTDDNYRVTLTTVNPFLDDEKIQRLKNAPYDRTKKYDREQARYLQSTPLIDAENEHVRQITDSLFRNETRTLDVINKAMAFVHGYLTPSDSLARLIDAGVVRTLDVNSVIEGRKGTCGEYSNLLASILRRMNIPTRYAVGYWYFPEQNATSTHAWVECWIDGLGWCSFDATLNSSYIFLHFACIRMRYGLDFEDCDIGLLSDDIEPLEIDKLRTYGS